MGILRQTLACKTSLTPRMTIFSKFCLLESQRNKKIELIFLPTSKKKIVLYLFFFLCMLRDFCDNCDPISITIFLLQRRHQRDRKYSTFKGGKLRDDFSTFHFEPLTIGDFSKINQLSKGLLTIKQKYFSLFNFFIFL